MLIPKSIDIAGFTVNIVFDDKLCATRKVIGEARYNEQTIVLDETVSTREQLEQAYIHEVIHWILFIMNENDLRNNEKFVDVLAHFWYQTIVSAVHHEEELEINNATV